MFSSAARLAAAVLARPGKTNPGGSSIGSAPSEPAM